MTLPPAGRTLLAVQERQRLFRESFCVALRQDLPFADVLGAAGPEELLDLAGRAPLAYAVLEVGSVPWDVPGLLTAVRSARPGISFVGLATSRRQITGLDVVVVPRTAPPSRVADLVQPGHERPIPFMLTATAGARRKPLSDQQLRVLSLLSLGLTTAQVASRLGLSERAVAKAKRCVFEKLGVQSQAEALSAALATGLLGPSRRKTAS